MLSHTLKGNMDGATLLAGDLDFEPLINALVDAGMYTTLWYEQCSTSDELISSADSSQIIDVRQIYSWASDYFRDSHPIPCIGSSGAGPNAGELVQVGTAANGEVIKLYLNGEDYYLSNQDNRITRRTDYYTFTDREVLKKWVKAIFFEFEWDS